MKTILIQLNLNERDYKLLAKYGFMFEKNINDYLHDIAEEMRTAKAENRKAKKGTLNNAN